VERIRRGEIWVIQPVPHPKPRPGLVISINPVNELCPDILLVPLTTKPGPPRVALSEASSQTGLKTKTRARCETLGPVHKSRLKKKIGEIPSTEFVNVEIGIKRVLGIS
jgi:mRNA-degrading endonuclease toxin of MazEF toxin-antitoxin module